MLLSFGPGLLALYPLLIPILFFTWPLPLIDLTVYPFTTVPARLNVAVSQGGCKFWILWYEHSIETSLAVLSHNIFFFSACFETNKMKKFRRVLTLAIFSSDHERVRYTYVSASVLFSPVQFSDKRLLSFRYDKNLKMRKGRQVKDRHASISAAFCWSLS